VDLDRDRRAHPTPPRPAPRGGPPPTLGTSRTARPDDPGPGPSRVSEHPWDDAPPGQRTETQPTRPRPATRIKEHPTQPTPHRRKTHQNGHGHQEEHQGTEPNRLNVKLKGRHRAREQGQRDHGSAKPPVDPAHPVQRLSPAHHLGRATSRSAPVINSDEEGRSAPGPHDRGTRRGRHAGTPPSTRR